MQFYISKFLDNVYSLMIIYFANNVLVLFVCLGFSTHSRIFTYMETSPLPVKCSVLMAIEQQWFLACHTNCDKGHPFIMVIPRTLDTHTYCRAFSSGADFTT